MGVRDLWKEREEIEGWIKDYMLFRKTLVDSRIISFYEGHLSSAKKRSSEIKKQTARSILPYVMLLLMSAALVWIFLVNEPSLTGLVVHCLLYTSPSPRDS